MTPRCCWRTTSRATLVARPARRLITKRATARRTGTASRTRNTLSLTRRGSTAGNKALKIKLPASTTTEYSFALSKYFTPPNDKNQASIGAGENRVFFRWYQMWPTNYAVIGSNHNGVTILGGNDPGTPRHIPPANGSGWFTCVMEHNYGGHIDQVTKIKESVSPYYGRIYAYWPGRAEDHWWPDGTCQGNYTFFSAPNGYPDFVKRPCFLPQRGRWYCYEFMVRINTIGKRDGEVKWWVDGELKGDWPDLFLRGVSSVTGQPYGIDTARIGNGRNTCAIELDKWYDNVVVARKYIGPMTPVHLNMSYSKKQVMTR